MPTEDNLAKRLNERNRRRKTIANLRETLENERSDATAKEAKRARSQVASAETRAAIAEAESAKLSELATAGNRAVARGIAQARAPRRRGHRANVEATLSEQRHVGGFARRWPARSRR